VEISPVPLSAKQPLEVINLKTKLLTGILSTTLITLTFISSALLTAHSSWACDAAGRNTHIGSLIKVDLRQNTFTILDAQSRKKIIFSANKKILHGLKDEKGSILVNYEKHGDDLSAVGVIF
jgi:hypothetical protein